MRTATDVLLASTSTGHDIRLVVAALAGIAVLVLLMTLLTVHPVLSPDARCARGGGR